MRHRRDAEPTLARELTIDRRSRLDSATAAGFRQIYEQSFPDCERDPTDDLLRSIEAGERLCYLASIGAAVAGLAVLVQLSQEPVAVLEYLAVEPHERSRGIGAALMDHLRAHAGPARAILLEVEPPAEASGEERRLRERRIEFYRRQQAVPVVCAPRYRAPSFVAGAGPVPYELLWLPLGPEAPPRLAGPMLRSCVRALLTDSYGLVPEDPLVAEVVDDLAC